MWSGGVVEVSAVRGQLSSGPRELYCFGVKAVVP